MKKNKYTSSWYKVFSLIFLFAVGLMSANAQSTTSASTDWNTTGTWTGATLPAAGNTVTVSNAITVNGTVINNIGAITVASGGSITMGASGYILGSSITIQSGGSLTLVSGSVMNMGSVTIQNGGTLTMTAGGKLNTGAFTNNGTYNTGSGVISNLIFCDNFNRSSGNSTTNLSLPAANGGIPTNASYILNGSGTGPFTFMSGTVLSMVGNPAVNGLTASFPSSTNYSSSVSLKNNGNLTWYSTIRSSRSTLPLASGSMYSVVLSSTTTNLTTSTVNSIAPANGYAVCVIGGTSSGNSLALGYFTGGLTVANFNAFITISNVVVAQAYNNVKVTYNPTNDQWGLSYYSNTTQAEPLSSTSSYTSASGSPLANNTYTSSMMPAFGFQEISTSTNTNVFDNFYFTSSPVIFSASAVSGLRYDFIDGSSGPSSFSSFTAKAGSLGTTPLIITPPAGYEISTSSSFTLGSSTASSSTTPAYLSITPNSDGTVSQTVYFRLKQGLSIGTYNGNIVLSSTGATSVNVAVTGNVIAPGPTNLSSVTNSNNAQNLSWIAPSNGHNVLVIAYNTVQSSYLTPTSSSPSSYTASSTFGSGSSDGNGGFVVYNGTGTDVDVNGLTNGTTYYYQAISYSGSSYDANTTVSATPSVVQPVTSLTATSTNAQSVVAWTNPPSGVSQSNFWDKILVVAYPTSGSISNPSGDGSAYTASNTYGSGTAIGSGYVVYNGTGNTVTVTNLTNLTPYTYAVFVRHGSVWTATAVSTAATPALYASGDFVSVANGNYNASASWNTWNGSALVSTASTPSVSNNVWVDGGYVIALSAAGSCKDLHVMNGTIEAGSYTGAVLTATTLPTTVVLTVAGSTIEVQSAGQIGVPITGAQTGDNANALAINTTASGASSSSLSTVTIFGTGGTINLSRLIINANNQNLVISHDVNLYYHASTNAGNGQAFGVAGTTSTNWTDAVTISSGATLTLGQLAGFTLASSTGTSAQVNFTLNVAGNISFTRGKTPAAITAGTGTNGSFTLNTASAFNATVNILNGGNIYATEFYPNGIGTSGANGSGQPSTINIASGGTLTIDSLIDLRNSNQTIVGDGTFRVLTRAATTANNASASLVKIGGSSLDAQVQVTTTPSYDTYTTFSYEGTTAQTTGTGANGLPTSIYNLQVNNSAGVTLSQATTVLDSVKMVSGLLTTTSSNLLTIGAPNPSSLVQATSTSYVNGPLAVTVASTSSTVRTFPIGANGVYSPVTLNVTQNTTSPRVYKATANVGGTTPSFTNATGTIATIDPNRYYTLSSTGSGSITSAYVTLGYSTAADVNAGINSFITTYASRMRVVGSTGTSWTDLGGTGVATSSGVGSVTSASNFASLGTFAVANAISLNAPPDLIAAPTASVSTNYDITYTDDPTWRAAITSVVFGTTTLVINKDYTISSGKITIIPNGVTGSLLRTAGTYTITVNATGYDVVSQDQVVSTGSASKLYVQRAPVATSNGVAFNTQPIVYIVDAYNNLVTGATDNITPSNGGASNWSLGGTVTPLSTTSGIATFTNLSGASASAITATITFTSTSYGSVTSNFSLAAPPTYYWVGGTTPVAWNTTNVWSTTKGGSPIATFTPSTTDVLIFDGSNIGGGATGTIQTWGPTSSTTVGRIILQNNANVSLTPSPSGSKTYTISGLYGTDLSIGSGSTLSTNASNTTTINIASGATAAISGNFNLGPVAFSTHTLQATGAGAVQFNSGSIVTINGNSSGSPFGTSASTPYGTTGSIVFNSGSKLVWNKSGDIFGGNKVVTFNSGSLFYIVYNAPAAQLLMEGNTFANIEVNNNGTATSNSGTSGFTCQSLKLSNTSKLVIGSTGGTCNYGTITTDAGATLTLNTAPTGTITNYGTINYTYSPVTLSGTIGGTIGLTGTTAAQTLNASGTVNLNSLTINNTAASSPGVTLSGTVNLAGTLTVTTGTFATGNSLTLKSTSITNTAVVGSVGGTITGNVTVERFIPAGFRAYRDMAPQVYGSGSVYSNWQNNGTMTSGSGIFITGTSATDANVVNYATQPAPNADGLDYSINGLNSASFYDNSLSSNNWTTISNTKTTSLDVFRGYRLLIRGDRSFNLATTPVVNYTSYGLRMQNATTLKATGNLIYGTVTYNKTGVSAAVNGAASSTLSTAAALNATSATAFSVIANPYACPVQWGTGTATNSSTTTVFGASSGINGSYWYLDPTASSSGKYIAFNAQTGSSVSGYTSTSSVISNGIIQPGQAVFIQNTNTSPSVVFKETAKQVSSIKQAVFGVSSPLSKIYLSINKLNATTGNQERVDGAAVAFSEGFTNTVYGPHDALKFANTNDNLSISDKGKNLSIDGRLPATANDKIQLEISKVSATSYQLVVDATNYIENGFAPYLVDAYRGTTSALITGSNTINFTADTSISASYSNRFSIVFKPTTLFVNSIAASATLNNKIATINWNTVGEKSMSRFEVEKSTDAKTFTKIGQLSAKNTATATYSTSDNSVTATTFYRIKAISEVGTVTYSNVAKVSADNRLPSYSLYPNPLKGSRVVNVSLTTVAAGKYTVTINNLLGQRVQEVAISHAGGNGSHAITVNSTMAKGTYSVTIRETASGTIVNQSNLSVN